MDDVADDLPEYVNSFPAWVTSEFKKYIEANVKSGNEESKIGVDVVRYFMGLMTPFWTMRSFFMGLMMPFWTMRAFFMGLMMPFWTKLGTKMAAFACIIPIFTYKLFIFGAKLRAVTPESCQNGD